MKLKTLSAGIAICYLLLAACSKKQADEIAPAPGNPGAPVTYSAVIGPLFNTKCAFCHTTGNIGASDFNFTGYSSVVANAARIKNAVLVTKIMPLTGSLSAAELASVKAWFDQGMPQ